MRKLTFGMNLSVDGYIAAPGGDLGWSVPSDELFQWWSDRVGATGLALYGRKLWQTMSSHWPTADQQAWRDTGADPVRAPLAGHAEGGVLLDDHGGRLERPPGHEAEYFPDTRSSGVTIGHLASDGGGQIFIS